MLKAKKIIKTINGVLGIISIFFGVAPLLYGIWHIGCTALIIYGALLLISTRIKSETVVVKILRIIANGITVIGIVFMVILIMPALSGGYSENEPATVVVMGCKVNDGQPSLMLAARLNVAYEILDDNSEYVCVVSGGHTEGEPFSEGEVMKNYLVEKGIDPDRIYVEDKAYNTEQNIEFSDEIIKENNLYENLIITTDGFHQFRSTYYARLYGYDVYCASSLSVLGAVPSYYIREMIAILEMFIL